MERLLEGTAVATRAEARQLEGGVAAQPAGAIQVEHHRIARLLGRDIEASIASELHEEGDAESQPVVQGRQG
eukprot:12480926-Heterocapsa_arctica.AAC.1